jgi:hypothetical protein
MNPQLLTSEEREEYSMSFKRSLKRICKTNSMNTKRAQILKKPENTQKQLNELATISTSSKMKQRRLLKKRDECNKEDSTRYERKV